jgi:putative flavoprotein involved in K+ transport
MTTIAPTATTDVAIIGGGQAGLAAAYELGRRGIEVLVLDAAPETGHSWRTRWDSLRLFTPAAYASLPGMPFPAAPDHHPTKDEVADYLQAYATRFALPIRHDAPVRRVVAGVDGGFRLELGGAVGGEVAAERVVVATGPYQSPRIPGLAAGLDPSVVQLHSSQYRRPSQLPPGGTVVVVGAGNSGAQIARELAATCGVHLAVGQESRHVPQRVLGRDLFWWLTKVGMLQAPTGTRRAARMQRTELVIGTPRQALADAGVRTHGRLISAVGAECRFEDGGRTTVDAVVWATGFTASHAFIEVPGALDEQGLIRQCGGVGVVPGLFTIGQPWQHSRGSALLGFVGADAARLADDIARQRATGPRQAAHAR